MKIIMEGIEGYKPWSGAVYNYNKIVELDKLEELEMLLEELYPNGVTMTMLNDILWFEDEFLSENLGIDFE